MTAEEGSFDPVFFAKRNYKLLASVRRDVALSIPVKTVMDTGAGPNLVHKSGVDPVWHFFIRPVQSLRLLGPSKPVTKSPCLIYLTVRTIHS